MEERLLPGFELPAAPREPTFMQKFFAQPRPIHLAWLPPYPSKSDKAYGEVTVGDGLSIALADGAVDATTTAVREAPALSPSSSPLGRDSRGEQSILSPSPSQGGGGRGEGAASGERSNTKNGSRQR